MEHREEKESKSKSVDFDFVIVGGGVAGVTCFEELICLWRIHLRDIRRKQESLDDPSDHEEFADALCDRMRVCLISASDLLKGVGTLNKLTESLSEVEVREYTAEELVRKMGEQSLLESDWRDHCELSVFKGRVTKVTDDRVDFVRYMDDDGIVVEGSMVSEKEQSVRFGNLLIATGGSPRLLTLSDDSDTRKNHRHPRIVALRDSESVSQLREKWSRKQCKRILIVGNGGISLELVYALWMQQHHKRDTKESSEIVWCVKHSNIGNTFLDSMSSAVLIPELFPDEDPFTGLSATDQGLTELPPIQVDSHLRKTDHHYHHASKARVSAAAVGPQWVTKQLFCDDRSSKTIQEEGKHSSSEEMMMSDDTIIKDTSKEEIMMRKPMITLRLNCQVSTIVEEKKTLDDSGSSVMSMDEDTKIPKLKVTLTNTEEFCNVDLIVCAMGVDAVTSFCDDESFQKSDDHRLVVDEYLQCMKQSNVFSAGDCCQIEFAEEEKDEHSEWFEMQLWTQSQKQGWVAAHSMFARWIQMEFSEDLHLCYNWQMFGHCTRFFSRKCVFLGRFNAQGLIDDEKVEYKTRVRLAKDRSEFVKLIVERRLLSGIERVVGAVLIGDTGLEETCENLILNRTDLSSFGEDFLSIDVDLEDMFD